MNYLPVIFQKIPENPPSQKEAWMMLLKQSSIMIGLITLGIIIGG